LRVKILRKRFHSFGNAKYKVKSAFGLTLHCSPSVKNEYGNRVPSLRDFPVFTDTAQTSVVDPDPYGSLGLPDPDSSINKQEK
jgi:hypothetical protein